MSKGITQKNWLNIVIIVISGLVLTFTLLGKFMDREVNRQIIESKERQSFQIAVIDFGAFKLINQDPVWSVVPSTNIEQSKIDFLVQSWKTVLAANMVEVELIETQNLSSLGTVLIYFSQKQAPLVIKVEQLNSALLLSFVSSGKQFIVEPPLSNHLMPASLNALAKSSVDN